MKVYAYTAGLPEPATGSQQVVWDDPVDGPSCPGTYCLNRPPVARCKSVTVPANETCTGRCGSVNDGSYDPDVGDSITCTQTPDCPYTMGTQRVTLTCTDKAGNASACEATVSVTPSSTSFPLGTSTVTYAATDVAGHQATCSTSITVTDTQPPLLTLNGGDTVALECGIDTYTDPGVTASDVCAGDLSS